MGGQEVLKVVLVGVVINMRENRTPYMFFPSLPTTAGPEAELAMIARGLFIVDVRLRRERPASLPHKHYILCSQSDEAYLIMDRSFFYPLMMFTRHPIIVITSLTTCP